MKKIFLAGLVVISVLIFIIVYWFANKDISEKETAELFPGQTISFSGEVREVSDNAIVINTNKGNLKILINKETEIVSVAPIKGDDGLVRPTREEAGVVEIKIGDSVNISAVQKNGELIGTDILLLDEIK